MMGDIKIGYLVGNGAEQNVQCGFIPDYVAIYNVTDSDIVTEAFLGPYQVVPFSSGGTTAIVAGNVITGATSGAKGRVIEVLEYSGTWAGGDAAGFFVVDVTSGTFQSENVDVGATTNLATVTANVTHSVKTDTAVGAATTTSAITRYAGTTGANSQGFTVGSVVCEEAKLLRYIALRGAN